MQLNKTLLFTLIFSGLSHFVIAQNCNGTLTASNDTVVCISGSGQLNATLATSMTGTPSYSWSPSTGLNNPNSSNPTFNLSSTTTYIVTATVYDSINLVNNGDFSMGNTGFTSNYTLGTGGTWGLLSNPGTFAVASNPNSTHTNFASCTDHTSGSGNMMVVNGASIANQNVWCQTVPVSANTFYDFSTWATSVVPGTPASLQFSINGVLLAAPFALSSATCAWQSFNATWFSGTSTSATICIVNQNTAGGGNDFALDDIQLKSGCRFTDTVTVTVGQLGLTLIDTTICQGDTYFVAGQLQSTSGVYVDTLQSVISGCDSFAVTNLTVTSLAIDLGNDTLICDGNTVLLDATNSGATYFWQDSTTAPTYPVAASGIYIVDVSVGSCTAKDTITVNVSALPSVDLGADSLFCGVPSYTLDATNTGYTYLWHDNSTNPTFNAQTTGNYAVTVTNIDGCIDNDDVNLTFDAQPSVSLGNDTILCQGSSVTLDAMQPTPATYIWNNNVTTSSLPVNNSGTYFVTATIGGCSDSDTIQVSIAQPPTISLGNDTSFCNVPSFVLDATTPNVSYSWQDNSTQPTYTATTTGLYSVIITDANGCNGQDNIFLNFGQSPQFDLGPDSIYCNVTSLVLDATSTGAISYFWGDSTTNPTLTVDSNGTYYVAVINADQCFAVDSISIGFVSSDLVELGNDTIICDGETLLLDAFNIGSTYTWQDGSSASNYLVTRPGTYSVFVDNSSGCSDSDSIVIGFAPPLELNMPMDTTFCKGTTITLNAYHPNATEYLWEGTSAYFGQNDPNDTSFIITLAGDYTITISNGCQEISQTIEAITEDCGCYPFIPNAFTPNNDGNNDVFRVYSDCQIDAYTLRIYDRWGSLIYLSTDISDGWDGTLNGVPIDPGVYIWMLEYSAAGISSASEERLTSGSVTIFR